MLKQVADGGRERQGGKERERARARYREDRRARRGAFTALAGALHGRHAAFAAPARSTTDVTAGYASVKRPGRQVFQDEANAII